MNNNGSSPWTDWTRVETLARAREETTIPSKFFNAKNGTLISTLGYPTSLRPQPESNAIGVSWTPPQDDAVLIRGYIIGWGPGVPDVFKEKVG